MNDADARAGAWPTRAFASILAAWGCLHIAAIFTENINWDEFALLYRVERMVATGMIQGGGRPGAIELVLAPLVRHCNDAVTALREARLITAFATFLAIAALYLLALRLRSDRARPSEGAWLAVALLVFALPFQRWSIQVRTDPFGIAWGLWGMVVWLGVPRRIRNAVVAGVCFGLGYLFTQKVLYVVLLGVCLRVAVETRGQPRTTPRHFLAEVVSCTVAAVTVFAAYRWLLPLFIPLPAQARLDTALETFASYRESFGTALYRGLLAALVPHLVLIALLGAATAHALYTRTARGHLAVSWSVLGLAAIVATFHTAMFPYFWITLGLFPALALAYSAEELAQVVPARIRRFAVGTLIACLLVPAAVYAVQLLDDTQHVQRDALEFVARDFGRERYGFQLEGALSCRHDPEPFPVYFRPHIERAFSGANTDKIAAFVERFQTKPVHFLIVSHMVGFFPEPIRNFWQQNYRPYYGPVFVVGREVGKDEALRWQVFAPGNYRWQAGDERRRSELQVDGTTLRDHETVSLTRGWHELRAIGDGGRLVFSVDSEPKWSSDPFYTTSSIREIIGGSYFDP
jgi:hypothetical protein